MKGRIAPIKGVPVSINPSELTNGVVFLRLLVPVKLAALALRELSFHEWEFQTAPWYVFVGYAFDSFIKLHYTAHTPTKTQ